MAALNAYQHDSGMHPFTCPHRRDGAHRTSTDLGVLRATAHGWVCPDCDYTQDWAHQFMVGMGTAALAYTEQRTEDGCRVCGHRSRHRTTFLALMGMAAPGIVCPDCPAGYCLPSDPS